MKYFEVSLHDIRGTTALSVIVHLIILLIFFVVKVSVTLDIPEFVEISFAQGKTTNITSKPKPAIPQPQQQQRTAEPVKETVAEQTPVKEQIQLPKRRMLEDDPPDLNVKKSDKKLATEKVPITVQDKATQKSTRDKFLPDTDKGQKDVIEPGQLSQSEKIVPDATKSGRPGLDQLFEIEGKAAERKILNKILPAYPPGYNKEGTIRIRFTILPNGMVGEKIPVLKTDAVLEQNALTALSKWRFSPVPQSAPQETVEGIITFRYKLK